MIYVLIASFIGSFGAVFLKLGAAKVERNVASLVMNPRLAAGISMFCLSSMFFVLGVQRGELSVLYPMVATGYIWTLLWSKLFFDESLTRAKVMGLALILVGITLIGFGNQ